MTETSELVEHFFRHEYANLVSVLTRAFGIRRLDLVEEMVGAAMVQAMETWKQTGVPDNPAAWIHRVARNKTLDALRCDKIHEKAVGFSYAALHQKDIQRENFGTNNVIDGWLEDQSLPDSLLRMMFVCCHPILDRRSQITLTLKLLCGFSVREVAQGLLVQPESAKKRIQRAKKKLATDNIPIEFPETSEAQSRLAAVHDVLYLMFNEGYSPAEGSQPIRDDICEEAVRLCLLLCKHSTLATPESKALLSLMLFHASRFESRIDALGQIVLLEDQDRSKWNRELIKSANQWLFSSVIDQPSRFHLEAVISAKHCEAERFEDTDWPTIVQFYDRLIELFPSPVYQLNAAIAVAQTGDFEDAKTRLQDVRQDGNLKDYFLLECAEAYVYEKSGEPEHAIDLYLAALRKPISDHQKLLIQQRLSKISNSGKH